MAKTITQLPDASVVNAADELIIQQSGVTKRATKAELLSGITNSNIDAAAAIAFSKLAALDSANILVGNASNVATKVAVTGDVTISNTGVTAIGSNKVVTAMVNDAAITPAKLSGAQTGSAPVYGARAWVNFDGTTANDLTGTYSQSGTTVTVTATGHGHIVGHTIYADITSGSGVDGTYTVATVPDANTFTYTAGTSLTTSGNITLKRCTVRGSGNISNAIRSAAGIYAVNFTTAMPDANYAWFLGGRGAVGSGFYAFSNGDAVAPSAQSLGFITVTNANGSAADQTHVTVVIFR